MDLQEIRAKYPQYRDMSDEQVADGIYRKHYSDMPREEFNAKIGLVVPPVVTPDTKPDQAPGTVQDRVREEYGLTDYGRRGSILPYGVTQRGVALEQQAEKARAAGDKRTAGQLLEQAQGETEFALPQIAVNMLESFTLPKHVAEGGEVTAEDAVGLSLDFLTPATAAKMARTRAMSRRKLTKTAPSTDDLLKKGRAAYGDVRKSGASVGEDGYMDFVAGIENIAKAEKLAPNINDDTLSVIKVLQDGVGRPQDIQDLLNLRRIASDAANTVSPDKRADRRTAQIILERVDDFIDETLGSMDARTARKYWQRARKSETIEAAIERAKLQASGFENGLRTQFRALLRNPKKTLRGFTDDEIREMRKIVDGGSVQNLFRLIGKLGFATDQGANSNAISGLGGLGVAAFAGNQIAGPPGAVAAMGLTQGASALARGAAERSVVNRADLVRALAATGGRLPRGMSPMGSGAANGAARISPALVNALAQGNPDIVGRDPRVAYQATSASR